MGPPRAPRSTTFLPLGLVRELGLSSLSGYLQAVCPELFGPVVPGFGPAVLGFSAESDPGDPLRSPGPSPHINFHEKSSWQTDSKAMSWHVLKYCQTPFDWWAVVESRILGIWAARLGLETRSLL